MSIDLDSFEISDLEFHPAELDSYAVDSSLRQGEEWNVSAAKNISYIDNWGMEIYPHSTVAVDNNGRFVDDGNFTDSSGGHVSIALPLPHPGESKGGKGRSNKRKLKPDKNDLALDTDAVSAMERIKASHSLIASTYFSQGKQDQLLPHVKYERQRRQRLQRPLIVKTDIRRTYPQMWACVVNTCQFDFMVQQLETFFTEDFAFMHRFSDPSKAPNAGGAMVPKVTGLKAMAETWFKMITVVPDAICTILTAQISVKSDGTATLTFKLRFEGTVLFSWEDIDRIRSSGEQTLSASKEAEARIRASSVSPYVSPSASVSPSPLPLPSPDSATTDSYSTSHSNLTSDHRYAGRSKLEGSGGGSGSGGGGEEGEQREQRVGRDEFATTLSGATVARTSVIEVAGYYDGETETETDSGHSNWGNSDQGNLYDRRSPTVLRVQHGVEGTSSATTAATAQPPRVTARSPPNTSTNTANEAEPPSFTSMLEEAIAFFDHLRLRPEGIAGTKFTYPTFKEAWLFMHVRADNKIDSVHVVHCN